MIRVTVERIRLLASDVNYYSRETGVAAEIIGHVGDFVVAMARGQDGQPYYLRLTQTDYPKAQLVQDYHQLMGTDPTDDLEKIMREDSAIAQKAVDEMIGRATLNRLWSEMNDQD